MTHGYFIMCDRRKEMLQAMTADAKMEQKNPLMFDASLSSLNCFLIGCHLWGPHLIDTDSFFFIQGRRK
jgi:hypothetical protein